MTWQTDLPLAELFTRWIAEVGPTWDPDTVDLRKLHARVHLVPFFGEPHRITRERVTAYGHKRLSETLRGTVQKERSTLRGLLQWCEDNGHISDLFEFKRLPPRAKGTPYKQRRRGKPTELTTDEVIAFLEELPEWSTPRGGRAPFRVRLPFVWMAVLGLRPGTLAALSIPEHWSPGMTTLTITDEIDKVRFGRELPLPEALVDSLRGFPEGPMFGAHDYRDQVRKAAKACVAAGKLPATKARTLAPYDLRHALGAFLAEHGNNLSAISYLFGHRRVDTTARYVKPNLRATERLLAAVRDSDPITSIHRLAVPRKPSKDLTKCEGWDLNPHEVSLASTSSHRGGTEPSYLTSGVAWTLEARSVALLEAAINGVPVTHADALDYARAYLLTTGVELHRHVADIIAGGEHMGRALVELARLGLAAAAPEKANEAT